MWEMSEHGQMILEYEPEKDALYDAMTEYFGNPTMRKMENADPSYAKYMTKTYCLLANECQYLVAIVKEDFMPLGHEQLLKDLFWVCFQTRTLPRRDDLPSHNYQPKRGGPLWSPIKRVARDGRSSTYKCEAYPITVTLLGESKGGAPWQDAGNIVLALQSFQTIVTFNDV
jgi:hypothetical protein